MPRIEDMLMSSIYWSAVTDSNHSQRVPSNLLGVHDQVEVLQAFSIVMPHTGILFLTRFEQIMLDVGHALLNA